MQDFDVIVIGGGAAGLMCAAGATGRGRRVMVLDHAAKVAEKIRISGGGRCNFTNLHAGPENFLSDNPRFCISALKRYSPNDFISLVDSHNIAWNERDHGQLFCDGSAMQIIDMLLYEARAATIQTATTVEKVARNNDRFSVETNHGLFNADSLVIATGGPSIPKMGASGFGYDVARQFGLNVIEPRPGLVPLTFGPETLNALDGLSGVSMDNVSVSLNKTRFSESLLFTHRGLSGPVILQISSYWKPGDTITINLLTGTDVFVHLKQARDDTPKKEVPTVLTGLLPKRLANRLADWTECNGRIAEIGDKALRQLSEHINAWRVTPEGSEGYRTAEVTVGGVDTDRKSVV